MSLSSMSTASHSVSSHPRSFTQFRLNLQGSNQDLIGSLGCMSEVSSRIPHELAGGAHEHVGERAIDSEMPANDGGADVMQGGRPHRCSTLLRNRNSGTTFTCAMRWTASSVSGRRSPSTVSTTSGSPGLVLFSEHASACVQNRCASLVGKSRSQGLSPGEPPAAVLGRSH